MMRLWSRLFRRRLDAATAAPSADDTQEDAPGSSNTVELPAEPFVFECRSCGKVFEARRKRPCCPECDSTEVSLLSE